jgi:putative membrane protein insertion efficiency factor
MTSLLLALIAAYQRVLSPWLGSRCRFHPSCAGYARAAIARFGATRGGILALWRIARCNPFSRGGIDEVPATFTLRHRADCSGSDAPH